MTRRRGLAGPHAQTGDAAGQPERADEPAISGSVYRLVFNSMNEGVVYQAADGTILAANPAAERLLGISTAEMRGRTSHAPQWQATKEDGSPFPGEEHPSMVSLRTGEPVTGVVMGLRRPNGEQVWISINAQPVKHPGESAPDGVVTTFHDITERKVAEERQALMVHELNHRVKNTLTVVQSMAAQTLKASPSPEAFAKAFNARLLALSHSHDVLSRYEWTGAKLRELLEAQVGPHQRSGEHRFHLQGPDVRLTPKEAMALGLALSELSTNAVKYGALSTPDGRVSVVWRRRTCADGRWLRMVWREEGGPEVRTPVRRGLGTRLIERGLPHEIGGSARVVFDPAGLVCEMEFRLSGDNP